jgi:hypothetical protein
MLGWLIRLVLFRILGPRVLAVLAVLGFIRRQLAGRKTTATRTQSASEAPSSPSGRSTPGRGAGSASG